MIKHSFLGLYNFLSNYYFKFIFLSFQSFNTLIVFNSLDLNKAIYCLTTLLWLNYASLYLKGFSSLVVWFVVVVVCTRILLS